MNNNQPDIVEVLDKINTSIACGEIKAISGFHLLKNTIENKRKKNIEYDLSIGHGGDALNLVDQILEQADLDPQTREALEVLRDAIDRVLF